MLATLAGCKATNPSACQAGDEPAQGYEGVVTLVDGKSITGRVGWNPVSQEYVVSKDGMTILIPRSQVERVVVNDPGHRRDTWVTKGP